MEIDTFLRHLSIRENNLSNFLSSAIEKFLVWVALDKYQSTQLQYVPDSQDYINKKKKTLNVSVGRVNQSELFNRYL